MSSNCCVCDSEGHETIQRRDAKSFEPLELHECLSCGHVQQGKMPSDQELLTYYSHHYRSDYKAVYKPKNKYIFRAGRIAIERLKVLEPYQGSGKSLLDVGAGGGEFVYLAKRSGWDATGIEPNVGYSEFARQEYDVQVRTATLNDQPSGMVDVVTMFHVLEHMPRPRLSMQLIHERLNPDGLLLIEIPNLLQKDASPHNVFFKAHVQYFNRDTLLLLTSELFECIEVQDTGNLRALFRKRSVADPARSPSPEAVRENSARFHSKGWAQYLFQGGGWRKPFSRIRRHFAERAIQSYAPREILDRIYSAET